MAASADFFEQRNAQAVLKHGLLTRYAYYFGGRAGRATSGRVAFIDGYAGEGRYEDGNPGSPLLLASQAERAKLFGRDVKLAFVEQDAQRRIRLEETLQAAAVEVDQLVDGSLEDTIDALLRRYTGRAVLLFVDPFGLGLSRATLERVLRRRSSGQPIDVLYHFSLSTVARMGRAVISGPIPGPNASQIDAALGAIGWRADFETASGTGEPTNAAISVAKRFGEAVHRATGLRCTSVPVRQRPGQLPKYLLMLFSANAEAHWDFADLASSAYVDWLHFCDRADYDANLAIREARGVSELFPLAEPTRDDIDTRLAEEARRYLTAHIPDLLSASGPLRPMDAVEALYGDMLGRARVKHVRDAIKRLHDAGRIDDDGKGDYWTRTIRLID